MNRVIYTFVCSLLLISGCQKNVEIMGDVVSSREFVAVVESFDTDSKTVLSGNYAQWTSDDAISVFQGHSVSDKFNIASVQHGTFHPAGEQVEMKESFNVNVAVYPYNDNLECEEFGYVFARYRVKNLYYLPYQTYTEESFAEDSFLMVAVTSGLSDFHLPFENICGGLRLNLKAPESVKLAVTSIELKGNSGEKIAGTASVEFERSRGKSVVSMDPKSSVEKVSLVCGEDGVELTDVPTEFIIALPPTVFEKGFTVTVNTKFNGEEMSFELATSKEQKVQRSRILTMPVLTLGEELVPQEGDYIDEYGINHGPGVEIDGVVWAPVNCGYHAEDFKYGKLYQWGRKCGQGYNGEFYDGGWQDQEYCDGEFPDEEALKKGPDTLNNGQDNGSYFYYNGDTEPYDWLSDPDTTLWNSGTEDDPVKTEYDPCPAGWRVPTVSELEMLCNLGSSWHADDLEGCWFGEGGSDTDNDDKVFFPAAGYRSHEGDSRTRGYIGRYWSSSVYDSNSCCLLIDAQTNVIDSAPRASGYALRCVKE